MKRNWMKSSLALSLLAALSLTACQSQVGKTESKTESAVEKESGTKAETKAEADGKGENAATKIEGSDTRREEIKGGFSDRAEAKEIVYHPIKLSPEEEEAWKKEPAYGKTIEIGYNGGLCTGTFGAAQEEGFYKAEGLSTNIVEMTEAKDAVATGKADIAADHLASVFVPAVNGLNLVFTGGAHSGCKSLYVLKDSDIKSTADLKGKTVSLSDGIGNSDHNIALRFFNNDGIKPEEVKYKVVANDAVIAALQNKEVQGAMLSDMFARKFVDEGLIRPIRSLTTDEDFKVEPCCVQIMNGDFAKENPITAEKLENAAKECSHWIEKNKETYVDLLLEKNWASGDKDKVLDFANSLNFGITDWQTEAAMEKVIKDYQSFGILDKNLKQDDIMKKYWKPMQYANEGCCGG